MNKLFNRKSGHLVLRKLSICTFPYVYIRLYVCVYRYQCIDLSLLIYRALKIHYSFRDNITRVVNSNNKAKKMTLYFLSIKSRIMLRR